MIPAKSNRSLRSIKSARSTKSMRTNVGNKKGEVGGEFLDLAETLPAACIKFQCPYTVSVKKENQCDDFYKALKRGDTPSRRKKLSIHVPQPMLASQQSKVKTSADSVSSDADVTADGNALTVTALYDTYNCLSEILLSAITVPRTLMRIMSLLVPHFQNLTTLTVKQCAIDDYIVYEIIQLLEVSTINAVSLDESLLSSQNYAMLLNEQCNLKSLSLSRCKIDDDACKEIAAKLHHGAFAQNLQLLNLSSNHITDIGVKYISDALRSNRHLRYLNLADNRISDRGADRILSTLTEFPLTHDEIINLRIRYMKYLKCKQALYLKYLNEGTSYDELSTFNRKASAKRNKPRRETESSTGQNADELAKAKAEMIVYEILGKFIDPFDSNYVIQRNGYRYCIGNMILSYLNLSYNDLSYFSVKRLHNVIMYQNVTMKSNQSGIVKVIIDGNNLPMCKEMVLLNELFEANIKKHSSKLDAGKRKNPISRN